MEAIRAAGDALALVMIGGVNYATGQAFSIERITAAAHAVGAMAGWDLAHWAGNLPARLHDWNVDFACWCSYKYLNSGPGAVAGCFVHERHGANVSLPRFAGWWGNDPKTRFAMAPEFVAREGADGWQLSNPPILALAPLLASLQIFDRVGMDALHAKSLAMTAYMRALLPTSPLSSGVVLTPSTPGAHGAQLSIAFDREARAHHSGLGRRGIICDFREPNIIRLAPAPLYNSFTDIHTTLTA
jgi:kynureninase